MDICSLTLEELTARLVSLGHPAYRAAQVFDWVYQKKAPAYEGMSSLPAPLREVLAREFPFPYIVEKKTLRSADGTCKFLWSMQDGECIETVFIPMEDHNTLCISSQAGCRFACRFCASGLGGWKRSLTTGEILGQVLAAGRRVAPERISHIVFMGTGEPFDNYDNVIKAVRLMNAPEGLNVAARRITISTAGLVPGIRRFSEEGKQIELSVSLHASNDRLREELMPVNRKYPLPELMKACRDHAKKTGRQVTFEYILIKGKNCSTDNARELGRLLKGWLAKVNLIPYNENQEFPFKAPTRAGVDRFRALLEAEGVHTTLRAARGTDIAAACGQLRHESKKDRRQGTP